MMKVLNKDFTKANLELNLNPYWVTGFIDGEGSFIIAMLSSTGPTKKKVSLRLSVTQKSHSSGVLYDLKNFFECGSVIPSSKDCMRYVVQGKNDIINKIIPHFCDYPLITSKQLNFESFKEAAEIVQKGEHLSLEGITKIVELKKKMNKNRSFDELFSYLNSKKIELNPFWVQAFIDAEGNFGTLITKSEATGKIVTRNRLSVSQSTHDYLVLKAIKEFFKAGNLSPSCGTLLGEDGSSSIRLEKARLCADNSFYYNSSPYTFIPFFENYPLYTRKYLDFQDFKIFYKLKKDKYYLTDEGFAEMSKLAKLMNSGRDDLSKSRRLN